MPTRIDWLPYGIAERAVTLRRIADGAENYGAVLGLSPAQVDRIKAIAEEYAFAERAYQRNKIVLKALRTWRDDVMSNEGHIKAVEQRPMFDNSPMPVGTQRGLIKEIRKYVRLIKASSGFEGVIGAAMGIMPPNHTKKTLRELSPQIKVTAYAGFKVKFVCEKMKMDAVRVEWRPKGEEKWQIVAFLTRLPETFYIEPAINGVPETGEIRAWFIKDNKPVGNPSNSAIVTIFGL